MTKFRNQPQLKKNIFSGTFTAGVSIVISFIAYPIYLHFLSANLYGLWSMLTVVIYFSSIGNLGVDEALVKFIAEEYERKNIDNVIKYISTSLNLLVINGVIIIVILILFGNILQRILDLDVQYLAMFYSIFPYVAVLSIFILIVSLINSILKGLGRFDQASYVQLSGRVASLAISVLFFIGGYRIWSLYWGQFLSFILILILSSFFIYKRIGFYYKPLKNDRNYLVKLIRFGGALTISKIIFMLLVPFVKIIIARYIGLAHVTYFEIANRIVLQIRSFFERGISAIMPEVSRLASFIDAAKSEIHAVMKKVNRVNFLLGALLFILLLIIGEPLLKIWLAEKYNVAIVIAFRIIIVGYLINLFSVPSYYYFMGIGQVKYCFLNHFIQAVLNFILILFLIFVGVINFQLAVIVYSSSVAISAMILIIIYYKSVKKLV